MPNKSQSIYNLIKDTSKNRYIKDKKNIVSIPRRQFIKKSSVSALLVNSRELFAHYDDTSDIVGEKKSSLIYQHGIASGDPLSDRVIIWTRLSHITQKQHMVDYQVATDKNFSHIVAKGNVLTSSMQDYTVKVDVTDLQPNTQYYYRFLFKNITSPIGKTKTLPINHVKKVRFAVFSCSNYPAGYFNVYAEAAKRDDFDVIIHLGDYIYEYGQEKANSKNKKPPNRKVLPRNELITESDYRKRYSQYKKDQDLQALHAVAPMIAVWDDHEIANNAYECGAKNHQKNEGSYTKRKMAAIKAYHEWLPIREQQAKNVIFRSFNFGDLVSLHMLDTRIYGRDKQLNYKNYVNKKGFDHKKLRSDLNDPKRQLLGEIQQSCLQKSLKKSSAIWQILGQQVLMGRMNFPTPILMNMIKPNNNKGISIDKYSKIAHTAKTTPETLTAYERKILTQPHIPYNLDAWDGYNVARETILETVKTLNKNFIVLSGDTHNAWANDLKSISGDQVGVEFATASVSSYGLEKYIPDVQPSLLSNSLIDLIPDLKYVNTHQRGYMHITLTPEVCQTDWIFVNTVFNKNYEANIGNRLLVKSGSKNRRLIKNDDLIG